MFGRRKNILDLFFRKPLFNVVTGIVLACIINLSVFNFEHAFVCIEVTSEKESMVKIYKNLQVQLLLREMQDVSYFDTIDNRVTLVIFVYNEMTMESCEEMLHSMVQNSDYSRIDYCIVY